MAKGRLLRCSTTFAVAGRTPKISHELESERRSANQSRREVMFAPVPRLCALDTSRLVSTLAD
jgi:hypothetical protein